MIQESPEINKNLCRPVRSAKAARRYLARLLQAYQRGEIDSVNAKTSTYILSEYLRAVAVSEFDERLGSVEKRLIKKENLPKQYTFSKE